MSKVTEAIEDVKKVDTIETNVGLKANAADLSAAVPTGVITMWSGLVSAVPAGWYLCDGTNGTPDLRDTFVFGASVDGDVNVTGGSADAVNVSHTHTGATNTTGSHSHSYTSPATSSNYASSSNSGPNTTASRSTGSSGNHSHSLTIDSSGESGTNKNLPPYMKLAYIMKG